MRKVNLSADIRENGSNRSSRQLRKQDLIPAVLYGKGGANTLLKINGKELNNVLVKNGENVVVQLSLGGSNVQHAVIKEVQREPIDRRLIHVDFQPVDIHDVIHADVPILVINGERMERSGMVINRQMGHLEVEGEVEKLPRSITVDASKLKLGDVLKVSDLEIAQELSIMNNPSDVVLSIKAFKEEPINLEFERTEPEIVKDEEN